MKTIKLRILKTGKVQAEVNGVKGKECTNYIKILEDILDAETIESEYTAEYHETNVVLEEQVEQKFKLEF